MMLNTHGCILLILLETCSVKLDCFLQVFHLLKLACDAVMLSRSGPKLKEIEGRDILQGTCLSGNDRCFKAASPGGGLHQALWRCGVERSLLYKVCELHNLA